jgi:MFS family permease
MVRKPKGTSVGESKLNTTNIYYFHQPISTLQSSFYWGYAIGQIPASRFVHYLGGKWMLFVSIFVPSLLTLLVPIASERSYSFALSIRIIIGLFESASFPSIYYFFPLWIPVQERTAIIPVIFAGIYFGEMMGFFFSGLLIDMQIIINGVDIGNWPCLFYLFGIVGLIWSPIWWLTASNTPESHKSITSEELEYIKAGRSITRREINSIGEKEKVDFQFNPLREEDSGNVALAMEKQSSSSFEFPLRALRSNAYSPLDASTTTEEHKEFTFSDIEIRTNQFAKGNNLNQECLQSHYTAVHVNELSELDEFSQSNPPWTKFFSHPVALTLFVSGWVYVSCHVNL